LFIKLWQLFFGIFLNIVPNSCIRSFYKRNGFLLTHS